MHPDDTDDTRAFEEALASHGEERYVFRLYVTGATPRSTRAVQNLRAMCEANLPGRYDLEVIDIYQQPGLAQADDVVVTPTLIKSMPLPIRRLIGDLSNADRVLISLDLVPLAAKQE